MNWPNEPATASQLGRLRELGYMGDCPLTKAEAAHLIGSLEPSPQANHTGAGDSGAGAPSHLAYALRLSVELTRRALAEGGADQANRFKSSLELVTAKRLEFWLDTCRSPEQMHSRSSAVLALHMKHGCRFVTPTCEQVQGIVDALDAAAPAWDRDNPELFYQALELNFRELLRHVLSQH